MTRIVVNGSFDILHLGHLSLLEYARSFPDSDVLVLIDTDRRIKELKGAGRPINNERERYAMLSALKYVDEVRLFDSDDELRYLIKKFNTDIMIKGSDYKDKLIIGSEYCRDIKFYDILEEYSTTKKIQDIFNRG